MGKGLWTKAVALVRFASRQKVSMYAAHASYFVMLAVFPTLVLILSLLRYSGLDVENLLDVLEGVFPAALLPSLQKLILSAYYSTTGTVISLSAITALWSAGRGIYGVLSGLNAIYGVKENRGYFYTRGISVVYTFAFLVVMQLTLLFHVFGTGVIRFLGEQDGFWLFLAERVDLRFFLLFFLQTGLFVVAFMVLPNEKNSFMESLPGALLSSVGWLVFSDLYNIYVDGYVVYTSIFGPVYVVALSMLWLYCCISIVFYGGVLNYWLKDQVNK